jgi:hypothetical protein
MENPSVTTQFHVTIDYRTKQRLGVWSGMVSAGKMEEAGELAERSLRRRQRAVVRIDRIVVR